MAIKRVSFFLMAVLLDVVRSGCNDLTLQACIAPLSAHNSDFDFSYPKALFTTINQTDLQTICSLLNAADLCVHTTTNCSSSDTSVILLWKGINDSVAYLCGDGTAGLAQFQTCLTSNASNFLANSAHCHDSPPNFNHSNPIEDCRFTSGVINCYVTAATIGCNSGEFVRMYATKGQQPRFSINNCILGQSYCDSTKLHECIASLNPGPGLNPVTSNILYPNVSNVSSYLQSICRNLTTANTCIQTSTGCASTDPVVQQLWSGTNDSMTYLCGEGQTDFIRYQQCLAAKPYLRENSEYVQNITECSGYQNTNGPTSPQDSCKFYIFYLRCYSALAKFYCDSEAFVSTYLHKYVQPISNSIGCILNRNETGGSPNNGSQSYCDYRKLTECIAPLNFVPGQNPVITSIINRDLLYNFVASLCSNLTTANACIQTSTGCTSSDPIVQQLWSGINDSTTYLCGEGQAGFIQYQHCLISYPELIQNPEYVQNITGCTGYPNITVPVAEEICISFNFLLRCYSAMAKIHCDSEEFVLTYLFENLQPQSNSIGCILNTTIGNCKRTKLTACMAPLNLIPGQNVIISTIYPNVSNFLLNLCRNLTTANACIQTSTGCLSSDSNVQKLWSGINDSTTYLCGEGQSDFIRYQQCMAANPNLIGSSIGHLPECIFPPEMDVCKSRNFDLRCFTAAAKVYCDLEEFVSTWIYKNLQPSSILMGCILDINITTFQSTTYAPSVNYSSTGIITQKPVTSVSVSPSNGITIPQPVTSVLIGSSQSSNGITTQQPVTSVSFSSADGNTIPQPVTSVLDGSSKSSNGITTQQPTASLFLSSSNGNPIPQPVTSVWIDSSKSSNEITTQQPVASVPISSSKGITIPQPVTSVLISSSKSTNEITTQQPVTSVLIGSSNSLKTQQTVITSVSASSSNGTTIPQPDTTVSTSSSNGPTTRQPSITTPSVVSTTRQPVETTIAQSKTYVKLTAQFKMKDKNFTIEFENLNSEESIKLSIAICKSFDEVLKSKTSKPLKLCIVLRYSEGSLVADTGLSFPPSTITDLQKQVADAVNTDFANPNGTFKTNLNSIVTSLQVTASSPDQSTTTPPDLGTQTGTIVGGTAGAVALLAVVFAVVIFMRK